MANSDKNIRITTSKNKTTYPNIVFTGSAAGSSVITLEVLDDNTLSFTSNEGQVFSIDSNLSTGTIWAVSDISGIPLLSASAGGTIGLGVYGGLVAIGQTNPTYKLDLRGSFGLASSNDSVYNFIFSNSAASGSNNFQVRSANSILLYNSGNTFYTGLKSNAAANVTYTLPTTDGSSGQFLQTNGSGTLTWATATGSGGTGSTAGVGQGGQYEMAYYPGTGLSVVGSNTFTNNTATGVVSITHTTASTDFSNGAFKVSGGVGIGGSLYVGGIGASIVGVTFSNSTITRGTWNGTVVSTTYGGTGQNLGSSSGVLTISSGTVSASTTSSALLSALSDETGGGVLVFNSSPSFGTGVTTGDSTFAVFNTNATTINAFGAATAINIGAASGTATLNSTTNSTSTSTGALVVKGGAGVANTLFVGGMIRVGNNTFSKSYSLGDIALDNGSPTDTPGITYYWGNNLNMGTDVFSDGVGSTRYRFVYNLNESGGREIFTVDTNGNLRLYNSTGANYAGFRFAGSANTTYTLPSSAPAGIAVSVLQSDQAGVMSWVPMVASSSTGAGSGTVAVPGAQYQVAAYYHSATGASVSGSSTFTNNTATGVVSITHNTISNSTSTGALVVTGGVGIGGSVFTSTSVPSSISGVVLNNGIVTVGTWSGSLVTAFYGGTGFNSYAVGDLLVASTGTSLAKLPASANSGWVLTSTGANSVPTWQAVPPAAASSVAVSVTALDQVFYPTIVNTNSGSGLGLSTVNTIQINAARGTFAAVGISAGTAITVVGTAIATNTTSGALQVIGGVGIGGSLYVGSASRFTSNTASISSGTGALTVTGGVGIGGSLYVAAASEFEASTAAIDAFTGAVVVTGGVGIGGSVFIGGASRFTSTTAAISVGTGALTVSGGAGIAGSLYAGGISAITSNAVSISTGTGALVVTGGVGIGGSVFTSTSVPSSISGVVFNNGIVTSGTWSGSLVTAFYGGTGFNSYAVGDLLVASTGTSLAKLPASANSGWVLTSTGANSVPTWQAVPPAAASSVAVAVTALDQVFYPTIVNTNSGSGLGLSTVNTIQINAARGTFAAIGISAGTAITVVGTAAAINTTSGALQVIGGVGIGGSLYAGGISNFSSNTASISSGTGALVVSNGVGIGGSLNVASASSISGVILNSNYLSATGGTFTTILQAATIRALAGNTISFQIIDGTNAAQINNTRVAVLYSTVSSSSGTGALVVSGGAGIGGSLYVASASQFEASTAAISVGTGAVVVTGGVGIGGSLYAGGASRFTSSTAAISSGTGALTVTGGAGIAGSLFVASASRFESSTASIDVNTGALTVTGGVGIGGSLFAGGASRFTSTIAAISTGTGALTVSGGAGIAGSLYAGGISAITSNAAAISTGTGAFVVTGGVGIGGSIYVGGASRFSDTTQSTTTNTGALVVTGGAAVGQTFSVGGSLNIFNGANYTGFRFAGSANTTYTLPPRTPTGTGTSFLSSSIDGVMAWVAAPSGGGGGSPSGSVGDVQYNSGTGSFAASVNFNWTNAVGMLKAIGYNTGSATNASLMVGENGVVNFSGSATGTLLALSNTSQNGAQYNFIDAQFDNGTPPSNLSVFKVDYLGRTQVADLTITSSSYATRTNNNKLVTSASQAVNLTYTLPLAYPSGTGASYLSASTTGEMAWVAAPSGGSSGAGSGTVAIPGAQYQVAAYYHSATGASVSGSSTFTNNTATGTVSVTHTTPSTSTSTGALVVSGSVGVGGSLFVGGQINQTFQPALGAAVDHAVFLQSNPTATTVGSLIQIGSAARFDGTTAGFFTGSTNGTFIGINAASGNTADFINFQENGVTVFSVGAGGTNIRLGQSLGYDPVNVLASFVSTVNSYNQLIIRNKSNGTSASANLVVNNDSSTDAAFYGELGINSSTFTGSGALNAPNATYVSATSGPLVLATTTSHPVRIAVNSGATDMLYFSESGLAISCFANFGLRSASDLRFWNSGNTFYAGIQGGNTSQNYLLTMPPAPVGFGYSVVMVGTDGQIYFAPASGGLATSQWGTSAPNLRYKHHNNIWMCAGFTPLAAGPDNVVFVVPDSQEDGTANTYRLKELQVRVETPSAGSSRIQVELSSTRTGAFSLAATGSSLVPGFGVTIAGAGIYVTSVTTFNAGTFVTSNDLLRLNWTLLNATHANFSIMLTVEEV